MKKPYLNQEERLDIKSNTHNGACLMFHFRLKILKRDIFKEFGLIAGWIVWRKVEKIQIFESEFRKNKKELLKSK